MSPVHLSKSQAEAVCMPCNGADAMPGCLATDIDLNALMIGHPTATYFMRLRGDAMQDRGLSDGDMVVVDRAVPVAHGDIVIAPVAGAFTIRELCTTPVTQLVAHNKKYLPIAIGDEQPLQVFGRVTWVVKAIGRH